AIAATAPIVFLLTTTIRAIVLAVAAVIAAVLSAATTLPFALAFRPLAPIAAILAPSPLPVAAAFIVLSPALLTSHLQLSLTLPDCRDAFRRAPEEASSGAPSARGRSLPIERDAAAGPGRQLWD